MKLGPITTPKPVRMNVFLPTEFRARLDLYAKLHSATWNEAVEISALIPSMLKAFLDADAIFRKAEKDTST